MRRDERFLCLRVLVWSVLWLAGTCGLARADAPEFSSDVSQFFELKVRPLLVEHCYECHSGSAEKLQAGLRLDGREFILQGGDSGPAAVAGQPDASLLLDAVRWRSLEMPPQGKLSPTAIDVLVEWVRLGLPWPPQPPGPPMAEAGDHDWQKLRADHWAFRPLVRPELPAVRHTAWPQAAIDHFVLARLEAAELEPAPAAEARDLARRIYFDLIGLPPTPEEVEAFEAATGNDRQRAVGDLVDRLLGSPHYGERWGRHWLDVARYSDGFGGFLDNAELPAAWRYRDWVVAAFNRDLPFDEFVRHQIAGDLVGTVDGGVATGLFALGPTYQSDGGDPESVAQATAETLADRVDTLGRGILGLTLACARCHDHKFDPIPQLDYYSLAGVFHNTVGREVPLVPPEEVQRYQAHQQAIQQLQQRVDQRRADLAKQGRQPDAGEAAELQAWQIELENLRRTAPPPYGVAHALADNGAADMKLAIRGDLRKPGPEAPRRFLRILGGASPARFNQGSGRRELAEAVLDSGKALTARVFVNRVWLHHMGAALVRSPDNFGALGEKPTHPELLDWLASEFVRSGWSIKHVHRTILLSATYQMSSRFDRDAFQRDGEQRLLWRMPPRRLDVEAWRDTLLAVTGELDRATGGLPSEDPGSRRRTIYLRVSRNGDRFASDEFLRLFDFPLMRASIAQRPTSIVPQQFLFLLNSPFAIERARALAARLESDASNDEARIRLAYRLLYGRQPTSEEQRIGLQFLVGDGTQDVSAVRARWEGYAQVLLSANEFFHLR